MIHRELSDSIAQLERDLYVADGGRSGFVPIAAFETALLRNGGSVGHTRALIKQYGSGEHNKVHYARFLANMRCLAGGSMDPSLPIGAVGDCRNLLGSQKPEEREAVPQCGDEAVSRVKHCHRLRECQEDGAQYGKRTSDRCCSVFRSRTHGEPAICVEKHKDDMCASRDPCVDCTHTVPVKAPGTTVDTRRSEVPTVEQHVSHFEAGSVDLLKGRGETKGEKRGHTNSVSKPARNLGMGPSRQSEAPLEDCDADGQPLNHGMTTLSVMGMTADVALTCASESERLVPLREVFLIIRHEYHGEVTLQSVWEAFKCRGINVPLMELEILADSLGLSAPSAKAECFTAETSTDDARRLGTVDFCLLVARMHSSLIERIRRSSLWESARTRVLSSEIPGTISEISSAPGKEVRDKWCLNEDCVRAVQRPPRGVPAVTECHFSSPSLMEHSQTASRMPVNSPQEEVSARLSREVVDPYPPVSVEGNAADGEGFGKPQTADDNEHASLPMLFPSALPVAVAAKALRPTNHAFSSEVFENEASASVPPAPLASVHATSGSEAVLVSSPTSGVGSGAAKGCPSPFYNTKDVLSHTQVNQCADLCTKLTQMPLVEGRCQTAARQPSTSKNTCCCHSRCGCPNLACHSCVQRDGELLEGGIQSTDCKDVVQHLSTDHQGLYNKNDNRATRGARKQPSSGVYGCPRSGCLIAEGVPNAPHKVLLPSNLVRRCISAEPPGLTRTGRLPRRGRGSVVSAGVPQRAGSAARCGGSVKFPDRTTGCSTIGNRTCHIVCRDSNAKTGAASGIATSNVGGSNKGRTGLPTSLHCIANCKVRGDTSLAKCGTQVYSAPSKGHPGRAAAPSASTKVSPYSYLYNDACCGSEARGDPCMVSETACGKEPPAESVVSGTFIAVKKPPGTEPTQISVLKPKSSEKGDSLSEGVGFPVVPKSVLLKFRGRYPDLLSHCSRLDPAHTGYLSRGEFGQVFQLVVPGLTAEEVETLLCASTEGREGVGRCNYVSLTNHLLDLEHGTQNGVRPSEGNKCSTSKESTTVSTDRVAASPHKVGTRGSVTGGMSRIHLLLQRELLTACHGDRERLLNIFFTLDDTLTGYLEETVFRACLVRLFQSGRRELSTCLLDQYVRLCRAPFEYMAHTGAARGSQMGPGAVTPVGSPEERAAQQRVSSIPKPLWDVLCDYRYMIEELHI